MAMDGLWKAIGKISDQFQGRIERLKNEKTKLLEERHTLLNTFPTTMRNVERINAIDKRVCEVEAIIATKATD